jgi:hypothetical protein
MARIFRIGGLVLASAVATAAPAFAGGFGGHMVSRPVMRGMAGHPAPIRHPRPNPLPQGYSFGYALPHPAPGYAFGYGLPHGRPGYDFGYALPYRGGYYGGGCYGGGTYCGGGLGGGYYSYDAGTAPYAPAYLPENAVYVEIPLYPVGYYGASDTATGNGVIYNLPFAPERPGPKIIRVSRRHGLGAAQPHVTVIRGGVVSTE